MKNSLVLALLLCLLALIPLGRATASEETHCYIVGDNCVIISNVCFLDAVDCGDGQDWFSQQAWKRGWCMAAIYAGVIHGTVWQCADGSANTIAQKVLIADVNGYVVLWQFQQFQVQQASVNGNQQSNTGGSQQQSGSNGGGGQQQSGSNGGGSQQGGQQVTGQTGGNQQQLIVLQSENPPPDKLPEIPPDQQNQDELLLQVLQQQQEPQYQGLEGAKGEQQQEETYKLSEVTHNGAGRHWSDGKTCMEYANAEKTRVRKCQSGGNEGGTFKGDPPKGTNRLPQRCAWCRAGNGVPIYTPNEPANGGNKNGTCSWQLVHRYTSSGLQSSNWVYNCY